MGAQLTIGELAREAGVPTSTLRYYERAGLLAPDARSQGNYRLYGRRALERILFIREAQASGFTIQDVKTILGHDHENPRLCDEVQALIHERLVDVKRRIDELRHIHGVLNAALKRCQATEPTGHCGLGDSLKASAPSARRRVTGRGRFRKP